MPDPDPALLQEFRTEVYVLFAFDVGDWVDLEQARRILPAGRDQAPPVEGLARTPLLRPPLVLHEAAEPVPVAGTQTRPGVDVAIYAFGAVSLRYTIDHRGSLRSLQELSRDLDAGPRLQAAAAEHARRLLARLDEAVDEPHLSSRTEDYLLFVLPSPGDAQRLRELTRDHAGTVAAILRGLPTEAPEEEAAEVIAARLAPSRDEFILVTWRASIAATEDGGPLRSILSLANVQHLELVLLDHRLDTFLEAIYESLPTSRRWPLRLLVGTRSADLQRLAEMELDASVLFERVTNASKFIVDRPSARLYQLAARRFDLPEWAQTIQRKLDTIQRLYARLYERTSTSRLEFLEWLIIALIALSILLTLK